MKENIRRVILFIIIVATGSVMTLADIPVIFMVPLVIVVGFILLVLLGAITKDEIRAGLAKLKPENIKKISVIQKLDSIKFFEKKSKKPSAPAPVKEAPKKPEKKLVKKPEKSTGIRQHLQSLLSSVKTLGTILKERGKSTRKVEDIDKMLDKTITEKVKSSALADAGAMAGSPDNARGGAGGARQSEKETDPFLSLSGDEFETGLLDSLDDLDLDTPAPAGASPLQELPAPADGSDVSNIMMSDMDLPPLPDDLPSDAEDILKSHAEGGELEAFSMPEGADSIDDDFGDLENINIDDVDLGNEEIDETPADIPESSAPAGPASILVQNQGMNFSGSAGGKAGSADLAVDQHEMASFAASSTGDDDLLSSLASEIKTVKIEKNISLLRDLKDFKAPASDIENELQAMSDKLIDIKKKINPGIPEEP
ncbi:MAG: hypothetical protein ABFC71_06675 [Methanoregula sp.]